MDCDPTNLDTGAGGSHEKGGKRHEMWANNKVEAFLDDTARRRYRLHLRAEAAAVRAMASGSQWRPTRHAGL
jgi:hypothetical protein